MISNYYINLGPLGHVTPKICTVTVLRGHTQIHIEVKISHVKDTSFGQDLLQRLQLWKQQSWGRVRDQPIFDLILQHCLPLVESLAPHVSLQELSLESFVHSPTYNLRLTSERTHGGIHIEGQNDVQHIPAFFTSPARAADLPDLHKTIPRFQARDINIAPILNGEKNIDAIHGRVITADGTPMFFKPRQEMRETEFERELCILSRIYEAGLTTKLRVPKLEGLVISADEEIVGLLMTMITSSALGTHLQSPGLQEMTHLHQKWEQQLTATIQELHLHGIVWGDVHPMNVVIDETMDAWAVDFGGMNNAEFIDAENRETVEGDWQGIRKIFQEWLPNPQRL